MGLTSVPINDHTAIISIGSNMGDKLENCHRAISALNGLDHTAVNARSRFYKTAPVDFLDQDWFVNAVVKIDTRLTPRELLDALQDIQRRAGRVHDPVRFGPRIIDLDVIFYDDEIIDTPELAVPHPRMHKRRFVLQPICDIDPAIVHPVFQQDVQSLLNQLTDEAQSVEVLC